MDGLALLVQPNSRGDIERPLWIISGLSSWHRSVSALHPKADGREGGGISKCAGSVCFTSNSRRTASPRKESALCQKRTSKWPMTSYRVSSDIRKRIRDVRFTQRGPVHGVATAPGTFAMFSAMHGFN